MIYPSANNSANERSERRRNWKNQIARSADADQSFMTVEAAKAKFMKLAQAFVASGKVTLNGGIYHVAVGIGAKSYPVYYIRGSFTCECRDDEKYGFCSHEMAAAMFAAGREVLTGNDSPSAFPVYTGLTESKCARVLATAYKNGWRGYITANNLDHSEFEVESAESSCIVKLRYATSVNDIGANCECKHFRDTGELCKHAAYVGMKEIYETLEVR